jgi:hypothetical protein
MHAPSVVRPPRRQSVRGVGRNRAQPDVRLALGSTPVPAPTEVSTELAPAVPDQVVEAESIVDAVPLPPTTDTHELSIELLVSACDDDGGCGSSVRHGCASTYVDDADR